jgi:hypothetical protein
MLRSRGKGLRVVVSDKSADSEYQFDFVVRHGATLPTLKGRIPDGSLVQSELPRGLDPFGKVSVKLDGRRQSVFVLDLLVALRDLLGGTWRQSSPVAHLLAGQQPALDDATSASVSLALRRFVEGNQGDWGSVRLAQMPEGGGWQVQVTDADGEDRLTPKRFKSREAAERNISKVVRAARIRWAADLLNWNQERCEEALVSEVMDLSLQDAIDVADFIGVPASTLMKLA